MTTLEDFGITPGPTIETVEKNDRGEVVCPRCDREITPTRGTIDVPTSAVIDPGREVSLDHLDHVRSHGYCCPQCNVLVPETVTNADANGWSDEWIGVPVRFEGSENYWIPVLLESLEQPVPASQLVDDGQGGGSA